MESVVNCDELSDSVTSVRMLTASSLPYSNQAGKRIWRARSGSSDWRRIRCKARRERKQIPVGLREAAEVRGKFWKKNVVPVL